VPTSELEAPALSGEYCAAVGQGRGSPRWARPFRDLKPVRPCLLIVSLPLLLFLSLLIDGRAQSGENGKGSCYLCLGIALILLFFIAIGDDNSSANDDNRLSGQAHHITPTGTPASPYETQPELPSVGGGDGYNGYGGDEEELKGAEEEFLADVEEAEDAAIEEDSSMLQSVLASAGSRLRSGLTKVFQGKVSDEEIEEIAKEVEDELEKDITNDLREEGDRYVQDEMEELDEMVGEEEEMGVDTYSIEQDVEERDFGAVSRVRTGIRSSYDTYTEEGSLRHRTADIEKAILEKRLSEKLGKQVKLVVVDDEVDDLDQYLGDLPSLRGSPATSSSITTGSNPGYGGSAPAIPAAGYGGYGGGATSQQAGYGDTEEDGYGDDDASASTASGDEIVLEDRPSEAEGTSTNGGDGGGGGGGGGGWWGN